MDRVALAEQCRTAYDYCISDMVQILRTSFPTYNGLCRVLQSEDTDLHEKLRLGKVSINDAIMKVDYPERAQERCQYHFLARVNSIDGEVIYQDSKHILYRYEQNIFLGVVCGFYDKVEYSLKEMLYLLDDNPCIIDTVQNLLKDGYSVQKSMNVKKAGEASAYRLTHYIMSAYSDVPLDVIKKATVSLKYVSCSDGNIRDLRISNLRCRAVPNCITPEYTGGFVVQRCLKNEIKIINQNTGVVVSANYSEWLYNLLQDKKDYLRLQSRDNRLCVPICGSIEYLYHICIAVDLYGVPKNEEDLGKKMLQFRCEYLSQKMQVDHLNGDCNDNHLSNLIIMTNGQNQTKQGIEKRLKGLGNSFFCWLERYDKTAVTIMAGYLHPRKPPVYKIQGVYSVSELLVEMDAFVSSAQEERLIFDEFTKLERKLKEDENAE